MSKEGQKSNFKPQILRASHTHTHTHLYIYKHIKFKGYLILKIRCYIIFSLKVVTFKYGGAQTKKDSERTDMYHLLS